MRVIGTMPVRANASWVSSPGTWVTIGAPGLNPSLVLTSAGSIGVPLRVHRHRGGLEVDAQAGVGARVRAREVVVGVREQALGAHRRDRVAAVGGVDGDPDRLRAVADRRVALHRLALRLDLALGLGLGLLSLVSMQLWTSRRPSSVSARRFDALRLRPELELLALGEPLLGVALADDQRDLDLGLARRLRRDLDPPAGDSSAPARPRRTKRGPWLLVLRRRGAGRHRGDQSPPTRAARRPRTPS